MTLKSSYALAWNLPSDELLLIPPAPRGRQISLGVNDGSASVNICLCVCLCASSPLWHPSGVATTPPPPLRTCLTGYNVTAAQTWHQNKLLSPHVT